MAEAITNVMRCLSLSSTLPKSADAAREICAQAEAASHDLGVVFMTQHHAPGAEKIVETLRDHFDVRNFVGCTAESVIGPTEEIEGNPGIVLWLANLPGVRILPFVLDQSDLGSLNSPEAWYERLGAQPSERPAFMLLPDPFSIAVHPCLAGMSAAYPEAMIVGGMASGAREKGDNRLFVNDQVFSAGAVGVTISGAVSVHAVVSQGCRPIGRTYVITKAQHNIIEQLGGKPVDEALKEMYDSATPLERPMIEKGLHVGRVVDEHLREFGQGDFLIRNITGFAPGRGMAIADIVRPGQTIQFHVRDGVVASEDLRTLLERETRKMKAPPRGGLLFSCNGRGTRLFDRPHHDIQMANNALADCPMAGFFAHGEIGPVGRRIFVHGFTACMMLFGTP